ncbi:MAG: hypothetical protein ACHQ1E_01885 [Ktedonobacterales bacterium]|jgi:hypothetical protein
MAQKRTPVTALVLLCLLTTLSACGQVAAKKAPAAPTPVPLPKGWNMVASPRVGEEGALQDVAIISANDAWAVGSYYGVDALQRTLTEHWDGSTWSVVSSPNPSTVANQLVAVSAPSSSDAWAVGQATTAPTSPSGGQFTDAPIIERWDGKSWAVTPNPTLGKGDHYLTGIAAISPTDVWAVGYSRVESGNGVAQAPLAAHWDGSSWKVVATPATAGSVANLQAVTAIASNDVWAVGGDEGQGAGSLIEHWNGSAWGVAQDNGVAVNASQQGTLSSISADGPNDVWAVGSGLYPFAGGCGNGSNVIIEHWDGQSWSDVNFPTPVAPNSGFFGFNHVAVAGHNDVWAVGGVNTYTRNIQPVAEHWDGTQWSISSLPSLSTAIGFAGVAAKPGAVLAVGQTAISNGYGATVVGQWTGSQWTRLTSPSPGTLTNELNGLAVIGPKDIWAVGDSAAGALSERWDGAQWTVVSAPNSATSDNYLNAVAGTSASDVWAVGSGAGKFGPGVAEHWDGSAWTQAQVPAHAGALNGVAALNTTDVWAVGQSGALHWNGSAWTTSSGAPDGLLGVTAVAANDVWAVGGNVPQSCGGISPAIMAHWNGKQWINFSGMPQGILYSVSAASSDDLWAVGDGFGSPLIIRMDGKQWKQVTLPSALSKSLQFARSVCAISANDVWIVGQSAHSGLSALHWDGQSWTVTTLKAPELANDTLNAVAAVSANEVWAVGSYSQYYSEQQSLIERSIS